MCTFHYCKLDHHHHHNHYGVPRCGFTQDFTSSLPALTLSSLPVSALPSFPHCDVNVSKPYPPPTSTPLPLFCLAALPSSPSSPWPFSLSFPLLPSFQPQFLLNPPPSLFAALGPPDPSKKKKR